jgi:hypothetical protein
MNPTIAQGQTDADVSPLPPSPSETDLALSEPTAHTIEGEHHFHADAQSPVARNRNSPARVAASGRNFYGRRDQKSRGQKSIVQFILNAYSLRAIALMLSFLVIGLVVSNLLLSF